MDAISDMNFDYIASGHYAKVVHSFGKNDTDDGVSALELSQDTVMR